ncbi:MAG: hypothetical protein WBP59_07000, partial [Ilumatobacteraceae bacterium]
TLSTDRPMPLTRHELNGIDEYLVSPAALASLESLTATAMGNIVSSTVAAMMERQRREAMKVSG